MPTFERLLTRINHLDQLLPSSFYKTRLAIVNSPITPIALADPLHSRTTWRRLAHQLIRELQKKLGEQVHLKDFEGYLHADAHSAYDGEDADRLKTALSRCIVRRLGQVRSIDELAKHSRHSVKAALDASQVNQLGSTVGGCEMRLTID